MNTNRSYRVLELLVWRYEAYVVSLLHVLVLGEGSVVKKRIFRFLARFFWPRISSLDPTPERTAEKKSTRPTR